MKYIFLLNRFTLKNKLNKYIDAVKSTSKKLKLDYDIVINDKDNSTEKILNEYKNSNYVICAVGGDGILNRTINSIYGTKNKVSCIPAGTGNDLYRCIEKEFRDGDNIVDLIKCNNKYFVNVGCFGIDADIANDKKIIHNKLIPKKLQYRVSAVKHFLKYKPYEFSMKWNSNALDSKLSLVAICNGGYYGGGFKVNPNYKFNDGMMDVFIVKAKNRREVVSYFIKLLRGKHKESKYVTHIKTNKFTIRVKNEIEANIDGESLLSNKFEMNVIPKAIIFYYNKKLIDLINKELGK